jgi:hypothetical protein
MTVLEHDLTNLAEFLKDQKIPYMVIGGFANIIWGEPRATIDIDVTIWDYWIECKNRAQISQQ